MTAINKQQFNDRDISWLYFNGRVLEEASRGQVPVLEKIKFLSIFSANLDEFYRVRMPAITALQQLPAPSQPVWSEIQEIISKQQESFGEILRQQVIPELEQSGIHFIYNQAAPELLEDELQQLYLKKISGYISIRAAEEGSQAFFPESNAIYLYIKTVQGKYYFLHIPSEDCQRLWEIRSNGNSYIFVLDDIIRWNLHQIFREQEAVQECYSFKVTRNADLNLLDEYSEDMAAAIEQSIATRDQGLATRLLVDGSITNDMLQSLTGHLDFTGGMVTRGGRYHNLKDLAGFPVKSKELSYDDWPSLPIAAKPDPFLQIKLQDQLLHTPYQSYETLLALFNAAATDRLVTEISVTLYRIAGDSRIAHALISAAGSGKKVTVFVELKARFDEANNVNWARKMKAAGVKIIYSIPGLKVHAKTALIKRTEDGRSRFYGVVATGNFNESTARFYTDHILMTANQGVVQDLDLLFVFLQQRKAPAAFPAFRLQKLLVAGFNLLQQFTALIDYEINEAKLGRKASVTIKLNNLEEETLISKLYEASAAGVSVTLLVRSICRIKPGVPGLSDHITVRRIVDRYLEHGRIFLFHHGGEMLTYMGSSDWMNRNIYRRIEVCVPVEDPKLKEELHTIVQLQLMDNSQAVSINAEGQNTPIRAKEPARQSQKEIYLYLKNKHS